LLEVFLFLLAFYFGWDLTMFELANTICTLKYFLYFVPISSLCYSHGAHLRNVI